MQRSDWVRVWYWKTFGLTTQQVASFSDFVVVHDRWKNSLNDLSNLCSFKYVYWAESQSDRAEYAEYNFFQRRQYTALLKSQNRNYRFVSWSVQLLFGQKEGKTKDNLRWSKLKSFPVMSCHTGRFVRVLNQNFFVSLKNGFAINCSSKQHKFYRTLHVYEFF